MQLLPVFEERPFCVQLGRARGRPAVFGLFCGFALGWQEVVYLILVGPIGLFGGFLGGIEHRGFEDGFVRGLVGGLVFGSFILLGHKLAGTDAEGGPPRPAGGARDPHLGGRRDARRVWAAASAPAAKGAEPAAAYERPRVCGPRFAVLAAVTAPACPPDMATSSYDLGSTPAVASEPGLDESWLAEAWGP